MTVVGRLPERIDRDRNGADLDRAEERDVEERRIEQQEQDALFGPHVEFPAQRAAEAVDELAQLAVGDTPLAALDCDMAAASFAGMAVDEVRRRVECRRHAEVGGGRDRSHAVPR